MMKLLLGAALSALMAFSLPALAADGTLPRIGTKGNAFVYPSGKQATLRGVSLCSLEWHKPLEQIERVTSSPFKWDANILRLPVQVREWNRVGPMSYMKDYLDPAVQLCNAKGVYCIIDWHEIVDWNSGKVEDAKRFWRTIAPRYASNPNIIYEVFNEPTEPKDKTRENWLAWKAKAQPLVDLVRAAAPDTLIIVGSPHWSQMPGFAVQDPFSGRNLAYAMHLYPSYKPDQWDAAFGTASEKIPVFMSEWGWSATAATNGQVIHGDEKTFGQPLKDYLNARPQIGWTAWSYDPHCGPAMLGPDQDMAAFVKKWLSEGGKQP